MSVLIPHVSVVLAALPTITPTPPPGSDKFVTVIGEVFWGIGLAFLAAMALGLCSLAWTRFHGGRAFLAASHLGVIAACAAAFSVVGQIMAPLVG